MSNTYLDGGADRAVSPMMIIGGQNRYGAGSIFISSNPNAMADDSANVIPTGASHASASIALQSGTGNVHHIGPIKNSEMLGLGGFGRYDHSGNESPSSEVTDDNWGITVDSSQNVRIGGNLYLYQHSYEPNAHWTNRNGNDTIIYARGNSANPIVNFYNETTSDQAEFLSLEYKADNINSSGHAIQVVEDAEGTPDIIYEVRGNGSGGSSVGTSFTGGHDNVCEDDDDLMPGLIVETTGHMWAHPTGSYETALPFTKLCQTNGSKKVFGVINGYKPAYISGSLKYPEYAHFIKNGWQMKPEFTGTAKRFPTGSGNFHLHTNSIGEGSVWVTNINGEIENGDFIESSVIKGYGRKQDDDIIRSKTVAKSLEDVDWDSVTDTIEYSGSAYKKYKLGVTYHCG